MLPAPGPRSIKCPRYGRRPPRAQAKKPASRGPLELVPGPACNERSCCGVFPRGSLQKNIRLATGVSRWPDAECHADGMGFWMELRWGCGAI